mmetsp:Transcript_33489/g.31963  ORF Transcript_33489/g.31963 Transcript_33489/m.31963 type:complete len:459 (+) Transcript_33489:185-1561(+)
MESKPITLDQLSINNEVNKDIMLEATSSSLVVNIHYSNVMEWLQLNNFIPVPKNNGNSTSPQDIIDIDIQFAKSHFIGTKKAQLPENISTMLACDVTYFDARTILQYLVKTDGYGSERNIFGMFNSDALKSWWTLLRSWEKGNLHLVHAVAALVKMMGCDKPNIERKFRAAEQSVRTIDNRFIELQRASLTYDTAYSDEYRTLKLRAKMHGHESDVSDRSDIIDLERLYVEINLELGAHQFVRSMDYVFAFSKFPQQGSQTAKTDYKSIYMCLRAINAIPSSTVFTYKGEHKNEALMNEDIGDSESDISDDLRLSGYIRDEYFSQELLLELQGLQAFLNQKLVSMEAEEESINMDMLSPSPSISSTTDVHSHVFVVSSIIKKLQKVMKFLVGHLQSYGDMVDREESPRIQIRLLRERAVKYRVMFEELKQNRQEVAGSLNRVSSYMSDTLFFLSIFPC